MSDLNGFTKVKISGQLRIAAQLGFVVRGFQSFVGTRGSGDHLKALSITRAGQPVSELYLGGSCQGGGYGVAWVDDKGEHREAYTVALSDEGELKLTPKGEPQIVDVPDAPVWR